MLSSSFHVKVSFRVVFKACTRYMAIRCCRNWVPRWLLHW